MDRVLSRCLRHLSRLHIHQDRAPEKERTGDQCYLAAVNSSYLSFDRQDSPMMQPKDEFELPRMSTESSKECGEKLTAATSALAISPLAPPCLVPISMWMPSCQASIEITLACFVIAKGFPCSSSIPFFVGFLQRLQIYFLFGRAPIALAALDVRI